MADGPHLDDVAGVVARVAQLVRPRLHNTIDRLACYEGVALERGWSWITSMSSVRAILATSANSSIAVSGCM